MKKIKVKITGHDDCLYLEIDNPELDDKTAYAITRDEIPEIIKACKDWIESKWIIKENSIDKSGKSARIK